MLQAIIDLFDAINQFEIFSKRNSKHNLLKKLNTNAFFQRNDEISWNIISKIILCQEISCDIVFKKLFSANISNKLYDEILDTMILLIQLNEFSDKNILRIITESNSASYQIVHLSKKRFYTKQLKKKLFVEL